MNYLANYGTYSKSPSAWGFPPDTYIDRAKGAKVRLNDGQWYTDWVSGLGSSILGFADPKMTTHLVFWLEYGAGSLSLPSSLERLVAEKLCHMVGSNVPGWKPDDISVRFAKTGSDVTTMAVRLARAVTGRKLVVSMTGHYHGWGEWSVSRTYPAYGVIMKQEVIDIDFGDVAQLDVMGEDIAAVIFEVGLTVPGPEYFEQLRQLCNRYGILLIVDEVVTGLRYGLGGACQRYGIQPDLVCMGKALGNGLPISALVGRRDYMDWFNRDDPVFCSSTFWGESLGLAAADYVLNVWDSEKVDHLWTVGDRLMAGLRESGWDCVGHGARSLLRFDNEYQRAHFIQGMRKRGILMNRPNLPTLAHTVADAIQAAHAAAEIAWELEQLEPAELARQMEGCLPRVLFKNR
jgi:glutamate-1-semialdehyde 2,1-aminomutase